MTHLVQNAHRVRQFGSLAPKHVPTQVHGSTQLRQGQVRPPERVVGHADHAADLGLVLGIVRERLAHLRRGRIERVGHAYFRQFGHVGIGQTERLEEEVGHRPRASAFGSREREIFLRALALSDGFPALRHGFRALSIRLDALGFRRLPGSLGEQARIHGDGALAPRVEHAERRADAAADEEQQRHGREAHGDPVARTNLRMRYTALGGPACTGSWARWRRRSAASSLAVG